MNSSLSSLAEQLLNSKIANILIDLGYSVYLPQEIIPPNKNSSSIDIFNANLIAIKNCDIVLSILDKPGLGVAFELGFAISINKPTILFRSDVQDYLGKIMEGLWELTDINFKASSLEELRLVMKKFVKRSASNDIIR